MNNDLLISLGARIERLYNTMISNEKVRKDETKNIHEEFLSIHKELEKTNEILEKIYKKL